MLDEPTSRQRRPAGAANMPGQRAASVDRQRSTPSRRRGRRRRQTSRRPQRGRKRQRAVGNRRRRDGRSDGRAPPRPRRRDGASSTSAAAEQPAKAEPSRRRRRPARAAASTSTASSSRATRCSFGPIGIGADPSDVYTVHYREPRGRRLRRAARVLDSDARERARARARQRDGHAASTPSSRCRSARSSRRARTSSSCCARRLRSVRRRAEQDAEQARVRLEGAVGSRPGDPRRSRPRTRTSAG